jgi:photosystem II stability/assembly factor-like uncharacterized protein
MSVTLDLANADDAIFALAASPNFARDGICFAACSSGLYRSLDGGASWRKLNASTELVTTAVAVSPAFAQEPSLFAAVKGGVLRSSDAGDTWFTATFPAPPPVFSSLLVSPGFERDAFLLAATMEDGVFSSTDRGLRWQPWNFGLFDLNVLCVALSPAWLENETIYAGTETGVYRSANGGRAWRHTGFPAECAPALCIACIEAGDSGAMRLIVGTEQHGLLASCDNGETWDRLADNSMTGAVNQLHVSGRGDNSPLIHALVEDGVVRSDDAGATWTKMLSVEGTLTAMLPLADRILLGIGGRGVALLPSR